MYCLLWHAELRLETFGRYFIRLRCLDPSQSRGGVGGVVPWESERPPAAAGPLTGAGMSQDLTPAQGTSPGAGERAQTGVGVEELQGCG